ncbi:MAG: hypothetical protein WCH99_16740 [Verrucomicrobiota bacterium]
MVFRAFEPADLPQVIEVYSTSIRCPAAGYTADQLAAWAPTKPDVVRLVELPEAMRVAGTKSTTARDAPYCIPRRLACGLRVI